MRLAGTNEDLRLFLSLTGPLLIIILSCSYMAAAQSSNELFRHYSQLIKFLHSYSLSTEKFTRATFTKMFGDLSSNRVICRYGSPSPRDGEDHQII